jgi:hypothetical protein
VVVFEPGGPLRVTSRIVLLFERKYSTVRASLIPRCQIEISEGVCDVIAFKGIFFYVFSRYI